MTPEADDQALYYREPAHQWLIYKNRYFRWQVAFGWREVQQSETPDRDLFYTPHPKSLEASLLGLREQGLID